MVILRAAEPVIKVAEYPPSSDSEKQDWTTFFLF